MNCSVRLLLVASLVAGSLAMPPSQAKAATKKYRVSFFSAFVGPVKVNGDNWDAGCSKVEQATLDSIRKAMLKAPPTSETIEVAVAASVAKWVGAAVCKPDPKGTVELFGGGASDQQWTLPKQQDTFTPGWTVDWKGVEISEKTRLRLSLTDADLANDDFIATVEIGQKELLAAAKAGTDVYVNVFKNGDLQLLYIKIAVSPE